jgi:hypothetical protein
MEPVYGVWYVTLTITVRGARPGEGQCALRIRSVRRDNMQTHRIVPEMRRPLECRSSADVQSRRDGEKQRSMCWIPKCLDAATMRPFIRCGDASMQVNLI